MENTYKVLRNNNLNDLEKEVNDLKEKGWSCTGNLQIIPIPSEEKEEALFFIKEMELLPKKKWNGNNTAKKPVDPQDIVGKCPCCGENLVFSQNTEKGTSLVKCENKDCNTMFSQYYKRYLTRDEAKKLFSGETVTLDKIVSLDGSTRSEKVKLSGNYKTTEGNFGKKTKWFTLEKV